MTAPTVIPGTKLLVLIGPGGDSPQGSPDVFTEPCGLTTKNFTLAASTNTTLIPDCADPSLPAWEAKDVNALSCEVTGTGVMACEVLPYLGGLVSRSDRAQRQDSTRFADDASAFLGIFSWKFPVDQSQIRRRARSEGNA